MQLADIVYADTDDDVIQVSARIRSSGASRLALVVPPGCLLFSSLTNAKILRSKMQQAGRTVVVVSEDIAARRLAFEAGFDIAQSARFIGKSVRLTRHVPVSRAALRAALENPAATTRIGRRTLSLTETPKDPSLTPLDIDTIPLAKPSTFFQRIRHSLLGGVSDISESSQQFIVHAPSRTLLSALVVSAVLLLFFVLYIAVPTATIHLDPRADPLSRVVNVTLTSSFESQPLPQNSVPAEFIRLPINEIVQVGTTGRVFTGENATGTITVYNKTPREKFFVPSRFLSVRDGIVFRSTRAVTVPPAVGDIFGSIDVPVVACEKSGTDCEGDTFIGSSGNIDPAFFIMPAITQLSPSLYYAESTDSFTGGVTNVQSFVSEKDIENAKASAIAEIERSASGRLSRLIADRNTLENRDLTLVDIPRAYFFQLDDITLPDESLVDTNSDFFDVPVSGTLFAVAYDASRMRDILKKSLEQKVHPDKRLTRIQFEQLSLRMSDINFETETAELVASINGIEEYQLDVRTAAGTRFADRIRARISGQPKADAERYLRSLSEINQATISSWPLWAQTLPSLPENISFELK